MTSKVNATINSIPTSNKREDFNSSLEMSKTINIGQYSDNKPANTNKISTTTPLRSF